MLQAKPALTQLFIALLLRDRQTLFAHITYKRAKKHSSYLFTLAKAAANSLAV
jgi:hypothetical protein